jgi:hypothetical protein
MLAEVAQAILELILQVILEFLCYWVGRLTVAVFTFGRVHCDFYDRESTWTGSWRIVGRDADGAYLTAEFTTFTGLLAIVAIIVCLLYFH